MTEKRKYTEEDIGDVVDIVSEFGTYYGERVVMTYCDICGGRFIGPIREAGGFLGGHAMFHQWQANQEAMVLGGYGE